MGMQSGMPEPGLPLFDVLGKNAEKVEREKKIAQERVNIEAWEEGDIGKSVVRDTCGLVNSSLDDQEEPIVLKEDVMFSTDRAIYPGGENEITYSEKGQELGRIGIFNIEHHGFYNVAVIEIEHAIPGHEYIHYGKKFNPQSGKYDGSEVSMKKISKGKRLKKKYRIQYVSGKINTGNHAIYCYGGIIKDGNKVGLNLKYIVPALKQIESLALEQIGLQ